LHLQKEALEKRLNEQKEALEKRLDEVRQTIEDAEAERELALAKMKLNGSSEDDIDQTRLEGVRGQIKAEIELERERISELQNLKSASPEQAEEIEREIREAKRKTADSPTDVRI
jgi:multidrug resistance efflux pump